MPTTIKLKNSVTTTNAPSTLQQGEVAINVTDSKVWVGNAATTPVQLLGAGATGSFSALSCTTLSASGVATFSAGTVSAPAITTTGDTNTGIFFPAADTIAFTEGGAEAMRIDSSGNVGIGTTSPSSYFSGGTNLVVGNASGNTGMTISSGSSSLGRILFADGTSGAEAYQGWVYYTHTDNAMSFATSASEQMRIDSGGGLQFNSGYGSVATAYGCRAWVNFNGTGTPAIRGSGNVSSITDNGTGDYTINFTTAMPDTNYAPTMSGDFAQGSGSLGNGMFLPTNYVFATGSLRTQTTSTTGAVTDIDTICFAIFR
jgi:hypothetical protein